MKGNIIAGNKRQYDGIMPGWKPTKMMFKRFDKKHGELDEFYKKKIIVYLKVTSHQYTVQNKGCGAGDRGAIISCFNFGSTAQIVFFLTRF